MTIDLRALDRDLDALAAGLAFPVSGGARGPLAALAELDAALAALSAGVAVSTSRVERSARVAVAVTESTAPSSSVAPIAAAPVELTVADEAPPGEPVDASGDEASPATGLAAQIAEAPPFDADERPPNEDPGEDSGRDHGSEPAVAAAAEATAAAEFSAGPASEPPTLEREALPSSEVAFGDVDPNAFDEDDNTALVSFASLAVFAERAAASAPPSSDSGTTDLAASDSTADPDASRSAASDAPADAPAGPALSAESLFGDEASTSLLVSRPLEFVGGTPPAAAPTFDEASVDTAYAAEDDDLGERVSVPDDLAALLEGELDPSEFGAPAVAAAEPLVDEATRVEDGDFEMFVEEDELFAVAEIEDDAAPGPAPLPATATSPSAAPPVSDTATLEGQEKKGFFKKIFGK